MYLFISSLVFRFLDKKSKNDLQKNRFKDYILTYSIKKMSINKAQLVFNNNTFTRKHIFSFLQISAKQRVDMIKQNKCEESVYLKELVVGELNYIRDNVRDMDDYDNPPFDEENEHFTDGIYRAMYFGYKSDIFVGKTYWTELFCRTS